MKNLIFILALSTANYSHAQSVTFSHVEKSVENKDKTLYNINSYATDAVYLGEIDVMGSTQDYPKMFNLVYQKAKEIGANSFALGRTETIEGGKRPFNPQHYYLKLYHADADKISQQSNQLYLLNISNKELKIDVNNSTVKLKPLSYISQKLTAGEVLSVSTRQLFGSNVSFTGSEHQSVQYFQIVGPRVRANHESNGGINFKTGDIVKLERSYAEFLLIYLAPQ